MTTSQTSPESPRPPSSLDRRETQERAPLSPDHLTMQAQSRARTMALMESVTPEGIREQGRRLYARTQEAIGILKQEDKQKFLESYEGTLEQMEGSGMLPGDIKDRKRALEAIAKSGRIPDPEKAGNFDIQGWSASIGRELIMLREIRRNRQWAPDDPRSLALDAEEKYLGAILDWFKIPHSPQFLSQFDVFGRLKNDPSREKANHDLFMGLRVIGTLAFAGISAIALALARKGKTDMKVPLFYAAVAGLCYKGKSLFDKKEQGVADQIAFMKETGYTSFVAKHNGKLPLAKAAETLFEAKSRARPLLTTLLQERDKKLPDGESRREKAIADLRDILVEGGIMPAEADALLQDPKAFAAFGLPPLAHARQKEAQDAVLTALGKPPPTPETL